MDASLLTPMIVHSTASKANLFKLRRVDAKWFNKWQTERHYLHRPVIRTKMLAHGIFVGGELVGGLLWSTPHFTKKKGLFGYPDLYDKWEVLMLARFYLEDGCGVVASSALMESIGKSGKGKRGSHRLGWRIQDDWCYEHPPKFPQNPYVPRLLISWSDINYGHKGIIYSSSGWQHWDDTTSNKRRHNIGEILDWEKEDGLKRCWILHLPQSSRAERIGLNGFYEHAERAVLEIEDAL